MLGQTGSGKGRRFEKGPKAEPNRARKGGRVKACRAGWGNVSNRKAGAR